MPKPGDPLPKNARRLAPVTGLEREPGPAVYWSPPFQRPPVRLNWRRCDTRPAPVRFAPTYGVAPGCDGSATRRGMDVLNAQSRPAAAGDRGHQASRRWRGSGASDVTPKGPFRSGGQRSDHPGSRRRACPRRTLGWCDAGALNLCVAWKPKAKRCSLFARHKIDASRVSDHHLFNDG